MVWNDTVHRARKKGGMKGEREKERKGEGGGGREGGREPLTASICLHFL